MKKHLIKASKLKTGAEIFAYHVKSPQNYGVVEIDKDNKAVSIEEKPKSPKSNWAVTGLYFYDNSVIKVAKNLKPSARGELEITDVNAHYLKQGSLKANLLGRGHAGLDTGTHEDLIKASTFIEVFESRQGIKIACLEEITYNNGWISKEKLVSAAKKMKNTLYGKYLIDIYKEK